MRVHYAPRGVVICRSYRVAQKFTDRIEEVTCRSCLQAIAAEAAR